MSFGKLLDSFKGRRALVIGDLMLDEYVFGRAARISPEAPVMVVRQTSIERLPGGAANVARNLKALGAEVSLVGVIGCDEAGEFLVRGVSEQGLDANHLVTDASRPTTRKTRVLADHSHQVLRIDHEAEAYADSAIEAKLIEAVRSAAEGADLIVMSDYLKGAITPKLAHETIELHGGKMPIVVNPKPRSLANYLGASLVSLNRGEAADALGLWDGLGTSEAIEGARNIQRLGFQSVLVTLGGDGMAAVSADRAFSVGAPRVEVADPAGAGDTVVATVALGLAAVGFEKEVFELAARTASCVVRHVGVATPSPSDLAAIRE